MTQRLVFLLVAACTYLIHPAMAQDTHLMKQLQQSHYLQYTMKADSTYAGITRWSKKKVMHSRVLPLAEDFNALETKGPGTISIDHGKTISGKGSILLETPASLGEKNPSNRSYAFAEVIRPLKGEDLGDYNRFSVWVYADAPGFYSFFVGCTLYNEGKHIMPAPGRFEGQHFVTVYPGKWQHIIWEIPDLYRDSVTGFSVNIMLTGSPQGAADDMKLYVDDMRIEKVDAENTRGFNLREHAIAYSHSGYKTGARKQALVQNVTDATFEILNAEKKTVFTGKGTRLDSNFMQLDFSAFDKPGYYRLRIGDRMTQPFPIGDDAYLATAWRTLNYFFAERCGYDQPGTHQACHEDVVCVHPDGRRLHISGGWHDAADLSQGVGNTARGGIAMLELARSVQHKNVQLYQRLLEEARWGLNWTMRTRFGDGYREGGLIIGIWTDNIIGTKDDIQGKATNNPFDNFIAASYCALAVPFYIAEDPVFANWCKRSAREDFAFASQLLGVAVNDKNETDLYALALVSAMQLYRLTKEQAYLDRAVQYARVVMDCQQQERISSWSIPMHGFFYESRKKKRILTYFHRSDEQFMVEGLAMLLTDAPSHPDAALWRASCQAYADYLHDISTGIKPYEILSAGIYEVNNTDYSGIYHEGDKVGMPTMEEYNAQVKNGIPLGGGFYLRRFPVAYQFRGFHAVLMAKAKAAFILADVLKDRYLRDIGTRQLEYIIGYNPFAMSTIYGDGYDYPPLYGAYAGDVVGAVPVGIETFENEDAPYMPMQVNATYKEIWTHTTASVIWLLSRLFKD
ncbi:glycoside hydrolase, family 9 protein [Chitinophaga agrisoli]|uniref:Glycoside hydrolase, family 9 protein n=1 Tax=Chitinophaga agrisoli TaxID=2607653 RepID=A0A5B2VIY3_9BACT|nr:glycoside hydrolase family 9 protein [Chitinophaga agrisoli]KAA2239533.1 glycoside hydrolase, family 9 protein [Chitinophaga agrisoli]